MLNTYEHCRITIVSLVLLHSPFNYNLELMPLSYLVIVMSVSAYRESWGSSQSGMVLVSPSFLCFPRARVRVLKPPRCHPPP